MLVFLWNWRSTLIAAIAIPTSIIATFGLIWYEDFTLNSMTMLALTLAVGIVIDDAIVVLENIYRFVEEKGMDPFQAAVEATKEIGLAVLATTLSLDRDLRPGRLHGRHRRPLHEVVRPDDVVRDPGVDARQLHADADAVGALDQGEARKKDAKAVTKDSRFFKPIDDGYKRLLAWSLAHRGLVAVGAVLILLSSVPLFMLANKNFLPNDDQSEFEIGVRAPEGTSIDATEIIANRIATGVRRLPEVDYTLVTIADDPARRRTPGRSTCV